MPRPSRAGDSVEDYCRACKTDRMHTVIAADPGGVPIRVVCGFCHSEHNFRGGPRIAASGTDAPPEVRSSAPVSSSASRRERDPFPIVSERERAGAPMSAGDVDLEMLLRRIIREE